MIAGFVIVVIGCGLAVYSALIANAREAVSRRHPDQHEHVPGEWQ